MTMRTIGETEAEILDRIAALHAQYVEEEKPERAWAIEPMPAIAWIMQKSKGTLNPRMVQSYVDGRNASQGRPDPRRHPPRSLRPRLG